MNKSDYKLYSNYYDEENNLSVVFKEQSKTLFSGKIMFNSEINEVYLKPNIVNSKLSRKVLQFLIKIISKNDIIIRDTDLNLISYSDEELYDMWLLEHKIFNYS